MTPELLEKLYGEQKNDVSWLTEKAYVKGTDVATAEGLCLFFCTRENILLSYHCQPMMGSMQALSIVIMKASAKSILGSVVLNLLQSQASNGAAATHTIKVPKIQKRDDKEKDAT